MNDRALWKIGGTCALAVIVGEAAGFAWALTAGFAAGVDVFDLEASQALPMIARDTRPLQLFLGAQVVAEVLLIPVWLALYQALRAGKGAYALLGAAAGVLSSTVAIVLVLPGVALLPTMGEMYLEADESGRTAVYALYYAVSGPGLGFLLTALRIPRVGFVSLALPRNQRSARGLAWLGIATAVLTMVEMGLWVVRGSPNDPLPVGGIAASLSRIWLLWAAVWLLRYKQEPSRQEAA